MVTDKRRNVDNKHYWIFEKTKFIAMWDDWYRGKVDPRKGNDIDEYRLIGRRLVLTRGDFALWVVMSFLLGALAGIAVVVGIWLW